MQPLDLWLIRQRRKRWFINIIAIAALLAFAGFLLSRSVASHPSRLSGRIIAVNHDLSLLIQHHDAAAPRRITLAGLHWPPPWNLHARVRLEQLVLGRNALATSADYPPPAMLVYLDSGLLLNETLCDQGLAQCDPTDTGLLHPWLLRVERWARSGNRGLWETISNPHDALPPDSY